MNPNQTSLQNIWGLNEPLRFPVGYSGWGALPAQMSSNDKFPALPEPFARIIPRRTVSQTVSLVASLIEAAPDAFAAVSAGITPEGWRQLYYRGTYVLDSMASPRFHADQALRSICEHNNSVEDPPPEWLGTSSRSEDVATDTAYALRRVGREAAMAAWAVLSAAQAVPLSQAEVLHCKFWDPGFLKSLSVYLNSR